MSQLELKDIQQLLIFQVGIGRFSESVSNQLMQMEIAIRRALEEAQRAEQQAKMWVGGAHQEMQEARTTMQRDAENGENRNATANQIAYNTAQMRYGAASADHQAATATLRELQALWEEFQRLQSRLRPLITTHSDKARAALAHYAASYKAVHEGTGGVDIPVGSGNTDSTGPAVQSPPVTIQLEISGDRAEMQNFTEGVALFENIGQLPTPPPRLQNMALAHFNVPRHPDSTPHDAGLPLQNALRRWWSEMRSQIEQNIGTTADYWQAQDEAHGFVGVDGSPHPEGYGAIYQLLYGATPVAAARTNGGWTLQQGRELVHAAKAIGLPYLPVLVHQEDTI